MLSSTTHYPCLAFASVAFAALASCVVSPPVEPEPPDENYPPFIDEFQPAGRTVQVATPNVMLRARIFDRNKEDSLSVAWFGKKSGFIKAGQHPIDPRYALNDTHDKYQNLEHGIFFEYEPAVFELSTCSDTLRINDHETIWLYVSDGHLQFPTTDTVRTSDGSFIESYSWDLVLEPDRCANVSR